MAAVKCWAASLSRPPSQSASARFSRQIDSSSHSPSRSRARAWLAYLRGDAEELAGFAAQARARLRDGEWLLESIYRLNLALADWLAGRGLRHGYGPFWDASIVTASSSGRVAVRPIYVRPISPERHKMVPLPWMTDTRWFRDEPATFVVLERGTGAAYQFGLTDRNCQTTFGPLAGHYEVGRYSVLVWDHDLRSQLHDQTP